MEFVPVPITMSEDVKRALDGLYAVDPNAYVAGGFVFDCVNGYPYNDIDIFVSHGNAREVVRHLKSAEGRLVDITPEYYPKSIRGNKVYELKSDDKKFNLIQTKRGLNELSMFDIRMREMYWQNGVAYASEAALKDVQDKKVRFGSFHNPFESLVRAYRFADKYGYELDPEHLSLMRNELVSLREEYPTWLNQSVSEATSCPYHKKACAVVAGLGSSEYVDYLSKPAGVSMDMIQRPILEHRLNHKRFRLQADYQLPFAPYVDDMNDIIHGMREVFRKLKLRIMLSPEPLDPYIDLICDEPFFVFTGMEDILFTYRDQFPDSWIEFNKLKQEMNSLRYRMGSFNTDHAVSITNELLEDGEVFELPMMVGCDRNALIRLEFSYGTIYYNRETGGIQNSKKRSLDTRILEKIKIDVPSIVDSAC